MTSAVGMLAYLVVSNTSSEVFFWLSNISAVSTLMVWGSICITYVRFHAGLKYHGIDRNDLPWKSPFQPYLAYFAIGFCSIVAFFNGYDCFFPGNFSAKSFVPPYIDIPIVCSPCFTAYQNVSTDISATLVPRPLLSVQAHQTN